MSFLSIVELSCFRNIAHAKIEPSEKINIIYGENGSGKTSLLEAIHHLSIGRSFRTSLPQRIIQHGQEKFVVFGEIDQIPVGIERAQNRNQPLNIHIDKIPGKTIVDLTSIFPTQLITQEIYQLIQSGPNIRRQFIDWGVFHVKHEVFLPLWRKMQRILKQRNAALKLNSLDKEQISLWNKEFVDIAEAVNNLRKEYLAELLPIFQGTIEKMLDINDLNWIFKTGWDENRDLSVILEESLSRDSEIGHTTHGPHRADLQINVGKIPAKDVLSRGQQKLLVCAMRLAQGSLLKNTQKSCVFLVDELAAELDEQNRQKFCNILSDLDAQVFITGTHAQVFKDFFPESATKMFHVKQGKIFEV